MFGLFKKKTSPEELVDRLRSHYAQVVSLVSSIDGPFANLYEAGIFVASVATTKILSFQKGDPQAFADQFNMAWVNYLISSYSVDGVRASTKAVVSRLQEKYSVYRELFLKTIDPNRKDKAHDDAVQLMWEIFSNCTGKEKPEREGNFFKLVLASGELAVIGARILKDVHE